jgi:hypothetical protein
MGDYAFAGSNYSSYPTTRTEIDLSNTKLKNINAYAFANNCSLTNVYFPSNLESIGNYAFQYTALTSISFPGTLKSIGQYAFAGGSGQYEGPSNNSLATIAVPDSVESIGTAAFRYCRVLASITLPSTISLGNRVFERCPSISHFTVSGDGPLKTDASGALLIYDGTIVAAAPVFTGEVTVPEGVIEIGADIFGGTSFASSGSQITKIIMPVSLEKITGTYTFAYAALLTEIVFPEGSNLTEINASYMFTNCTSLKTIDFSKTKLKALGGYVFYYTPAVESCILPDTVTNVGASAFHSVKSGFTLTIHAENPPASGGAIFSSDAFTNTSAIYVPTGSVEAYKEAAGWSAYAEKIQAIPE